MQVQESKLICRSEEEQEIQDEVRRRRRGSLEHGPRDGSGMFKLKSGAAFPTYARHPEEANKI